MTEELCQAIERRDENRVNEILSAKINVNIPDSHSRLAVNVAASVGNVAILTRLLAVKPALDIRDGHGKYALQDAALSDNDAAPEIVRLLLAAGADPDLRDSYHETAVMTACYWSSYDVIEMLVARTKEINYQTPNTRRAAIHYAAMARRSHDADIMGLLLRHGADPDLVHDDSETPLIIATRSHCVRAVRSLLHTSTSLDYQGDMDYTALHWAVYTMNTKIVKMLLDKKASVDLRNCLDRLPLHVAASFGDVESAKLLLEAGADTESTDSNGLTPLLIAVLGDHRDLAKLMLFSNADTEITDIQKRTGFMIALEENNIDMAKDLFYAGCDCRWFWRKHGRFAPGKGPEFFRNMLHNQGKMAEFQDHLCEVQSLQHLCRLSIRRKLSRGWMICKDIECLSLPTAIKQYLTFTDILPEVEQ